MSFGETPAGIQSQSPWELLDELKDQDRIILKDLCKRLEEVIGRAERSIRYLDASLGLRP